MKIGDIVKVKFNATTAKEKERLEREFVVKKNNEGRQYRPSANEQKKSLDGTIVSLIEDASGKSYGVRVFGDKFPPGGRLRVIKADMLEAV